MDRNGFSELLPSRGVEARLLAPVLGVLAVLGVLGATLTFAVDLFVAPWRLLTSDAEESLHLSASVIGLLGALSMYQGSRLGKPLVLAGLGLNVIATILYSSQALLQLQTAVPMLTWLLLACLTLSARRA